jgi:hypothetical protein
MLVVILDIDILSAHLTFSLDVRVFGATAVVDFGVQMVWGVAFEIIL